MVQSEVNDNEGIMTKNKKTFKPARLMAYSAKSAAVFLAVLSTCFISYSEDVIPKKFEVERYKSIWEKSPFTIPTIGGSESPNQDTFAEHLALKGWADDFVLLYDKQSQKSYTITTKPDPEQDGIILVSLQKDDDITKASAIVQRGEIKAKVNFDPSLLTTANNPAMAQNQDMDSGMPPQSNMQPQMGNPNSRPVPLRINRRRIIPTPQPQTAPNQNQNL
jgi:hypothetical protein